MTAPILVVDYGSQEYLTVTPSTESVLIGGAYIQMPVVRIALNKQKLLAEFLVESEKHLAGWQRQVEEDYRNLPARVKDLPSDRLAELRDVLMAAESLARLHPAERL